ncbi:hypothetical protein AYO45_03825 [Gammaproteobacteria bacterium SCGC AG-212-F23]|nr:hypothetical protein AYO45_03825 [Gammaproteobacteria bacterium SCGC AG-212-F23]
METERRKMPWANIGIIFSGLAAVVLIMVFFTGYHQLLQTNQKMSEKIEVLEQSTEKLHVAQMTSEQTMQTYLNEQKQIIAQVQQHQDIWKMANAQYLVRLADAELTYENNPALALTLLKTVDDILTPLTDPKLLVLRKALAVDLAQLKTAMTVDVTGIYARIAALNNDLDKLPLPTQQVADQSQDTIDTSKLSWWQRGLVQIKKALKQIVTVRYHENGIPPLVLPNEQVFFYENLHAMLEKSMWALLHRNTEIYRDSLQQTANWIKQYCLPDSPITQSALTTLSDLEKIDINPAMPKIAATLQAFHNYFVQDENPSTPSSQGKNGVAQ